MGPRRIEPKQPGRRGRRPWRVIEARPLRLLAQERDGRRERSRDVGHQGRRPRRRRRRSRSQRSASNSTSAGSRSSDLQARNRDLELKLEDAAERFRAVERSGSTSTTEELTDVLHAAERALSRLTDGARKNAEKQLGETEQVHDALRQDIDRLAAWRARMAPLAEAIPDSIQRCGRRRRPFPSVSDKRLPRRTMHSMHWRRACPNSPSRPNPRRRCRRRSARSSRWVRQRTDPRRSYPTRARRLRRAIRTGRTVEHRLARCNACAWSRRRPHSQG